MDHILFSLIVPMYNAEKYLPKCLQSIMMQTFPAFEVLLVDDASTDGTVACCKENIGADGRFRIIESDSNAGVSASRNRGLKQAQGDWIWFIDADDWIEPNSLEQLAKVLTAEADMVAFDYIKDRRGNVKRFENRVEQDRIDNKEFCAKIFDSQCHFQSIWSSIFRKDFLLENGILFDERLSLKEDSEYIVQVGKYLNRCVFVKLALYHYVVNMDSASQKWEPGVGAMNVKAAVLIRRDIQQLDNAKADLLFYHFMQDVVKVAILKDFFHPSCPLRWNERKFLMNELLENEYVKEILKCKYEGNMAKKWIWFAIVHRCYLFLHVVSWAYYCMQGNWFWKLYSKIYKP